MAGTKVKSAAERQRERRRRQRQGVMLITVEVPARAREVLLDAQWLQQWDEDDPASVRAAVQRLIHEMRVDGGAD